MFFSHTDAGNIIRREIGLSSSFAMLLYLPQGLLSFVSVELPVFSGIGALSDLEILRVFEPFDI